ncbi:MAG: hypothetical protein Q8M92_03620 [Candidatus Subteraquimicrobiales bacterium]|nr:hypothetical protein [Candidatus Subteraquimicrobiales bacterium]
MFPHEKEYEEIKGNSAKNGTPLLREFAVYVGKKIDESVAKAVDTTPGTTQERAALMAHIAEMRELEMMTFKIG